MKYIFVSFISFLLGILFVTVLFFKPIDPREFMNLGPSINFSTQNAEFVFHCRPLKGRNYESLERNFENFKENNPELKDLVLYRTTRKNYFNINMWCQYKNQREWQYDHISNAK